MLIIRMRLARRSSASLEDEVRFVGFGMYEPLVVFGYVVEDSLKSVRELSFEFDE